jgi:hypothetical protein
MWVKSIWGNFKVLLLLLLLPQNIYNLNIMNILKFIESFSTESLMNVKGSRRDIFSQVGLWVKMLH